MTVVQGDSSTTATVASTTWMCQQFRVDGVTVACSVDMHCALTIDGDGSASVSIGGITVEGVVGAARDGLVYRGVSLTDAPWGTPAGSCEDRVSRALTGRLSCEHTPDRLTLSSGSTVLHFVLGP